MALDIRERHSELYSSHSVTRKGKGKSWVFSMRREMEHILGTSHALVWGTAGISDLNDVYLQLLGDSSVVKVLGVQSKMHVT